MSIRRCTQFIAAVLFLCVAWSSQSDSLFSATFNCTEDCSEWTDCSTACTYIPCPECEAVQTTCGDYGLCVVPCECGDGLCNGANSGCSENCDTCPEDCGGTCIEPTEVPTFPYCGDCLVDSDCAVNHYCDAGGCCKFQLNQPKAPTPPQCITKSDCNATNNEICHNRQCAKSGTEMCVNDDGCGRFGQSFYCEYGRCKETESCYQDSDCLGMGTDYECIFPRCKKKAR